MTIKTAPPIILASASPRRAELLRQAGYRFTIAEPTLTEPKEPPNDTITPGDWAQALAYFKARSVADCHKNAIVIGADTIVVHGGKMIGKPDDQTHAREILSEMFGGRNEVITGLAVLGPTDGKRVVSCVSTTLLMRPMAKAELEEYMASGAWQGKAGAYALQEGGDKFVQAIEGSESNIVGLPMERLCEILERLIGQMQ